MKGAAKKLTYFSPKYFYLLLPTHSISQLPCKIGRTPAYPTFLVNRNINLNINLYECISFMLNCTYCVIYLNPRDDSPAINILIYFLHLQCLNNRIFCLLNVESSPIFTSPTVAIAQNYWYHINGQHSTLFPRPLDPLNLWASR